MASDDRKHDYCTSKLPRAALKPEEFKLHPLHHGTLHQKIAACGIETTLSQGQDRRARQLHQQIAACGIETSNTHYVYADGYYCTSKLPRAALKQQRLALLARVRAIAPANCRVR